MNSPVFFKHIKCFIACIGTFSTCELNIKSYHEGIHLVFYHHSAPQFPKYYKKLIPHRQNLVRKSIPKNTTAIVS